MILFKRFRHYRKNRENYDFLLFVWVNFKTKFIKGNNFQKFPISKPVNYMINYINVMIEKSVSSGNRTQVLTKVRLYISDILPYQPLIQPLSPYHITSRLPYIWFDTPDSTQLRHYKT